MQPHEMHEIDGADPQQNDRSGVSLEITMRTRCQQREVPTSSGVESLG